MSIPDQISALEELAAVDTELRTIEEQLSQERTALEGLKGSLKRLEDKLAIDKAGLTAIEKSRNEHINEVRTLTQQIEVSRDKMNRARNEREQNAVQRELEELRKLSRDRELEAGRATTDSDALRIQIENTEKEAAQIREQLGNTEGSANARIAEIDAKRVEAEGRREVTQKKLPPAMYRKYENIRTKRSPAVAQTTDGTCRACHMALPPQLFHRLRREPLIEQCPSCFRIIYYAPPTSAGEANNG